jgi:acetyl-CoA C-acetyltransferase
VAPIRSTVEHHALGLRSGTKQGGVELMDRLDRGRLKAGGESHPVPGGMIETAENLRAAYGITRADQDEFAARSHRHAIVAQEDGRFSDELVPVTIAGRRGRPDTVVDRDEHPRSDATVESLGALRGAGLRPRGGEFG